MNDNRDKLMRVCPNCGTRYDAWTGHYCVAQENRILLSGIAWGFVMTASILAIVALALFIVDVVVGWWS